MYVEVGSSNDTPQYKLYIIISYDFHLVFIIVSINKYIEKSKSIKI